MPLAGFELTIPVFKWAKTFHALDCAATVTDLQDNYLPPFLQINYSEIIPNIRHYTTYAVPKPTIN
jgi:hypothetical protein